MKQGMVCVTLYSRHASSEPILGSLLIEQFSQPNGSACVGQAWLGHPYLRQCPPEHVPPVPCSFGQGGQAVHQGKQGTPQESEKLTKAIQQHLLQMTHARRRGLSISALADGIAHNGYDVHLQKPFGRPRAKLSEQEKSRA